MADARASGGNQRLRFSVDLRPGETTIVSWKKLTRESGKTGQPAAAGIEPPALLPEVEPQIDPGSLAADHELKDAKPPQNRFNSVIEKIERLYKGAQSSDEELDDVPDDDQYDTELDEYFQVDKLQTKHSGFFVNRGKLARVNEPLPSPNQPPKKRRRKDLGNVTGEKEAMKLVKMGGVRTKAAARNAPLVVNKLSGPVATTFAGTKLYHDSSSAPYAPNSVGLKTKHVNAAIKSEGSWLGRLSGTAELSDSGCQIFSEKSNAIQVERFQRRASRDNHELAMSSKLQPKEKSGRHFDFGGIQYNSDKYPRQNSKLPPMFPKEDAGLRSKGTMLERAIRELEKKVAESRPPTLDVQDNDAASQGIKRRLPHEVKQKLAKVARLAQSSQGRISEELINRLMCILGHLVQLKTLKRNLKAMVELGLSAKQEKEDRFQQIKREVMEMIRMRVSALNAKEAHGSDDTEALKGRYIIDNATEDRLYDLYELYVEGMDEDKGPQIRKLYVELAELWPEGWMDNYGIKQVLSRAKERKRAAYSPQQDGERMRKKRISSVRTDESTGSLGNFAAQPTSLAHARVSQEKHTPNSNIQELTFLALPAPLIRSFSASSNGGSLVKQKLTISKSGMATSVDKPDVWHRVDVTLSKKPKIKPEVEPGGGGRFQQVGE